MERKTNIFDKIGTIIPGYNGYQEREGRRECDRQLREQIADKLSEIEKKFSNLVDNAEFSELSEIEKNRKKINNLRDLIKYSSYGASSFFADSSIKEQELADIYQMDLDVLDSVEKIESDIEINNIFKLAKTNQFKQFWITTRNFNALFSYIPTHKIPNNLNIMFSTPIKPNQFFIDFCKKYKIQLSEIVLTQKESNCPSSINRKSCIKNKCEKCFNYSSEVRKFHIHGKGNKEKLKEIYNNVD